MEADRGEVTTAIGVTMADLSLEVHATSPEEVGTLVCAGEIQRVQVSTYQDGGLPISSIVTYAFMT